MSVSLLEVIEAGGYNIDDIDDAKWLQSKKVEFESLIEQVEETIEKHEEQEDFDPQPEGDFSGASEDPEFGGR